MKTLLALGLVAVLAGCAPANGYSESPRSPNETELIHSDANGRIFRFNDRELGNLCYLYNRRNGGGGISCLPERRLEP